MYFRLSQTIAEFDVEQFKKVLILYKILACTSKLYRIKVFNIF